MSGERLTHLTPGMPIVFGGDRVTHVSEALAAAFKAGDRLIVVQETGDLLHVPAESHAMAAAAVERAVQAFAAMNQVSDDQVSAFFVAFADRLAADEPWAAIAAANAEPTWRAPRRAGPFHDTAGCQRRGCGRR